MRRKACSITPNIQGNADMDIYQKALATFIDVASCQIALPASLFPALEKHPLAHEGRKIMFPFLGEMGVEIRAFLGQIEPWLRSGWVIPARRVGLYPVGGAFDDPVFFDRVTEIKKAFGLYEICGRLAQHGTPALKMLGGLLEENYVLNISAPVEEQIKPFLIAQKELRRAFIDRYANPNLLPTEWHLQLSRQSHEGDDLYYAARHATIPSYMPEFFARPPFDFYPHIGVQLRNVSYNSSRNSDPQRMGQLAAMAAEVLKLPVLIYGRPSDFNLPGYKRTIDYLTPDTPQMNAELTFLKTCKLMISPDSGWTDLMGWLRVPTLLERLYFPGGFEALRPFRPKILLAEEALGITDIITRLCNADDDTVLLPNPDIGEKPQFNFTHPLGDECRAFWQDYYGPNDSVAQDKDVA